MFDSILQKYPTSPRALYGKARALDSIADKKRSNEILQQSITSYIQVLNTPNSPDYLFEIAASRCIDRMHFLGRYMNSVGVIKKLIERFPNDPVHKNRLAITYLTTNKVAQAKQTLQEILAKYPNDGVALVHYGFILKTSENKLKEGCYYMRKGIETEDEGTIDGRFYFHLGDALARLGRTREAEQVYEKGFERKLFLKKNQRSLYNVARLEGKPWWDVSEMPERGLFLALRENWRKIRDEGLALINQDGFFKDEAENLRDVGEWKQLELFVRGIRNKANCLKAPVTCEIVQSFPEASGCKRGQVKFSIMHPGTHVWPHCGPTNCRLRVHLGLKVPNNTFIRVAENTRSWKEGEVLIFDDSFEHEVWHNGTQLRLILIVDIWHPELTALEKKNLTPI